MMETAMFGGILIISIKQFGNFNAIKMCYKFSKYKFEYILNLNSISTELSFALRKCNFINPKLICKLCFCC